MRTSSQLQEKKKKVTLVTLTRCTGAGESGKSTIIKQMRIIHSRGFPEEERHQTRAVIYSNIVVAFKVLLDIMNAENIDFEDANTQVNMTCSIPFSFIQYAHKLLIVICGSTGQYRCGCRVR